jgi:hypothetical protein
MFYGTISDKRRSYNEEMGSVMFRTDGFRRSFDPSGGDGG